jgi:hypothetical protein
MAWPQATDYNAAIQNPQLCFSDLDLRQGQADGDLFGLPRPHSGNFADVYQVRCPGSQLWAVKCFTRPLAERGAVLRRRYQAISDFLRHSQRPFMVDFHYIEEGICVRGQWLPILKMRWVEGKRLNDFLAEHCDKPALLDRLMHLWLRLAHELREARIGHGDLQHGNVLLVPASRSAALALRLIDYDGLSVPALAGTPSGEFGHPNYQHPQRRHEDLPGPDVDRFAHLVIYTTLRALRAGGPELWRRHDGGENLLFREKDFLRPGQSRLFAELAGLPDPDLQQLAGHLLLASQGPLNKVPFLGDLVHDQLVRPLSPVERQRVLDLVPAARKSRLVLTAGAQAQETLTRPPGRDTHPGLPARKTMLLPAWLPQSSSELPTVPPPEPPPRRSRLEDPLLWLACAGLAILACLLLAVRQLRAPAAHEQEPPPPSSHVELDPLPDLAFEGGHQRSILIKLSRNGCPGDLTVHAEGLPAGVSQQPCVLATDREEAHLVLSAGFNAECPSHPLTIAVWQGNLKMAEQEVQLTVTRFRPPRLRDIEPLRLEPGEKRFLRLAVQREGYTGSLRVEVNDLPPGVSQRCLPAADGASTITLELTAAEKARSVTGRLVAFQLWADGDKVGAPIPVVFNLEKHYQMPRVLARGPLRLAPGGSEGLTVQLERMGYPGPVKVRLDGLPKGVSAESVTIPRGLSETLPVKAAADAAPGSHKVKVLAFVDEHKVSDFDLVLNIERPEPAPPPVEVEKPRVKREKEEKVTFTTVDHAVLRGTYYRGSKGKKSGCVMLLHDLKRASADEACRKLALQLHARGHTVLAFDFRGHGESTRVEPGFWKEQVNHVIRSYQQGAALEEQPKEIKYDDFPNGYYVWLIHDLAAARMFLENKHDDKDEPVNMKNVVIVGAGQGATLGTVWLETEGYRHRILNREGLSRWDHTPESDILAGVVWVGMDPMLPGRDVRLNLIDAGEKARLPTVLLFGGDDKMARDNLGRIFQLIRNKTRFGSDLRAIPGTAAFRQHLLDRVPRTSDVVCEVVDNLLGIRFEIPWMRRQVAASTYHWIIPDPRAAGLNHLMAKSSVERQLRPVPLPYLPYIIRVDGQKVPVPINLQP